MTGPWLAGVSGVAGALAERLPQYTFVESTELASGEAPMAVVFVVSAATTLTGSDVALLDAATPDTDAVIGVVSKVDLYPNWRDVPDHRPRHAGHLRCSLRPGAWWGRRRTRARRTPRR
ncbi:hypothetical protein H7I76_00080 [Mycolicibacterium vaccae]|nr:hypothetical protein [Mycolicibacterium vaccae]